jgi:hypothetical protein
MHRSITIHGDAHAIRELAHDLPAIEGVIAVEHKPDASLKPKGDVLQVQVLNRAADEVLRRARPHVEGPQPRLVIAMAQATAIIDPKHRHLIETDADEMLWEEMEADLRNHGRISANYLLLMAIGGIIASVGLTVDPVSQAIAFVGASIIAPAFEPVAKFTQALVLRNFAVCGRALLAIAVGYAVLFLGALGVFFALSRADVDHYRALLHAQEVVPELMLRLGPLVTSAGAAIAGIIMVVSLRDLYVVGPLMVLVIIPGLALAAASLAVADVSTALGALRRVGADLGLVVVLGGGVFLWKQRSVHRRRPLS